MRRLGYESWVAQGGDWGAVVTITLAADAPKGLKGVHLNMAVIYPPADMEPPTPEEQKVIDDLRWHVKWDSAYQRVQGTRPQTLGYSLSDSPIGQAAWIYEKCYAWTDNDGDPEDALSMDQMLDNISLYWFTNTGGSSARLYWELGDGFTPRQVDLPVGVSLFPREILRPSRRWVDRYWNKVVYWNAVERGGHFAAWEEPDLFVEEMRRCFGMAAFR
jgi:pimeloyl-ACP methyl ester carboxylesterase